MHNRSVFSVLSGTTSVSLGSTFKQLTGETSPVSYTIGGFNTPVEVVSREQTERLGYWVNVSNYIPTPGGTWPIRVVFIEQNSGGNWTLNIPPQCAPTLDMPFNVSAYYFPAALALGTDSNALTNHGLLADGLVNLVKAMAYETEDPTDKRAIACRMLYEDYYNKAIYQDTAQQFGGRELRM